MYYTGFTLSFRSSDESMVPDEFPFTYVDHMPKLCLSSQGTSFLINEYNREVCSVESQRELGNL